MVKPLLQDDQTNERNQQEMKVLWYRRIIILTIIWVSIIMLI